MYCMCIYWVFLFLFESGIHALALAVTYLRDFVVDTTYTLGTVRSSGATRSVFCPHYHTLMRSQRYAARCVVGCDGPRFILVCPEGHSAGGFPLCSCGPSAGPRFPYWSKAKAVRARQSHLSQRSCRRGPCRFVARCTRWGSCPLGRHHHSSRRSPPWHVLSVPALPSPPSLTLSLSLVLFLSLSLSENDQKSKSVPQSPPLFTAEEDVQRRKGGEGRKGGKWKRKLLMSLNHERLGLGLAWFGIQGSLVPWLRG